MRCAFCGLEFRDQDSRTACQSCALLRLNRGMRSCGRLRCPRCGYENPIEPSWLKRLRQRGTA